MQPIVADRIYTFGALCAKSMPLQIIASVLAVSASASVPSSSLSLPLAAGCLLGFALNLVFSTVMRAAGRFGMPGVKPLVIHWTNTSAGVARTSAAGYATGSWDSAPFSTSAAKSMAPLLTRLLLCLAVGAGWMAAGILAVATIYAASSAVDSSLASEMFAVAGMASCLPFLAWLIACALCRRFAAKHLVSGEHPARQELMPAILALSDKAPMYLSRTTRRARHCVQMNGHVQSRMRYNQPNSAAGDLY